MADSAERPSLTQYFDAPDNYRSVFGWVCGYSADKGFLNEAVERFTRETLGQRASRGSLVMALMLDSSHPAILPIDVPGLAHLPVLQADRQPFRLLHAKVALLGFRHQTHDGHWMLRLIVSTGNWTRQTLEESLDLGWCIEVTSEELQNDDNDLQQRCADIQAAWSLFTYLHGLFDLRVLKAGDGLAAGSAQPAMSQLANWVDLCLKHTGEKISRFIDSRQQPLLTQLPSAIEAHAGSGTRNYLAMGSGFFEASPQSGSAEVPVVLERIVNTLTDRQLLIKSPWVEIYVNPAACQAVASALQAIRNKKWDVRQASSMEDLFGKVKRTLHAKFLFGATERKDNNTCLKSWVYLGSGNLTGPGFTIPMSHGGGNLEAGVVFAPRGLQWYPDNKGNSKTLVTRYLPIQWNKEFDITGTLQVGNAMPPPGPPFVAAPVAWLVWQAGEDGGRLCPPPDSRTDWKVLDAEGRPCPPATEGFTWVGNKPRQVRIQWEDNAGEHTSFVPVIDEFGRLAATPLGEMDFDEVWWALAGFPNAADEDAPMDDDDNDPVPRENGTGSGSGAGSVAAYPIRQMMELVERIAERQTTVLKMDWVAWCARLEQTLFRVKDSKVLKYFRKMGLNPISPLRLAVFRPDYAEDGRSPEGLYYESVLQRIEAHWNTAHLAAIGEDE